MTTVTALRKDLMEMDTSGSHIGFLLVCPWIRLSLDTTDNEREAIIPKTESSAALKIYILNT